MQWHCMKAKLFSQNYFKNLTESVRNQNFNLKIRQKKKKKNPDEGFLTVGMW